MLKIASGSNFITVYSCVKVVKSGGKWCVVGLCYISECQILKPFYWGVCKCMITSALRVVTFLGGGL